MEFLVGLMVFSGLLFVSASLDKIGKSMADANALKKAELLAAGIKLD